jgi:hypothetical protein
MFAIARSHGRFNSELMIIVILNVVKDLEFKILRCAQNDGVARWM